MSRVIASPNRIPDHPAPIVPNDQGEREVLRMRWECRRLRSLHDIRPATEDSVAQIREAAKSVVKRGRQPRRPSGDKMTDVPFKVGDRVKKRSGYEYPGFIVSVFTNRAGAVRYVVEADHPAFSGMLHIFNGDQLEHR